jgi:hypothetical protein
MASPGSSKLTQALITICAAGIPWLFFVTVGWIAAGFTRF